MNVDAKVVERAKRYAADRGTSLSRLIETYLDQLARASSPPDADLPPMTRRLRGILKGAKHSRQKHSRQEHVDHLGRKYR